MPTFTENACFRGCTDCTPAANLSSDTENKSFICVGWNSPKTRPIPQDRFTLCWKNSVVDEQGCWDKRDLLDTMSVIAQALSVDENVRVNQEVDEDGMQQLIMVG